MVLLISPLIVALLLISPLITVAHPYYVACDLSGTLTNTDLWSSSSIMGFAVAHDETLATPSTSIYADGSMLTWTWSSSFGRGFVKASAGTLVLNAGVAVNTCTGADVAAWTNTAGASFTWTAPADVSDIENVTFSFIGNANGGGKQAVRRYRTMLNRTSIGSAPNASTANTTSTHTNASTANTTTSTYHPTAAPIASAPNSSTANTTATYTPTAAPTTAAPTTTAPPTAAPIGTDASGCLDLCGSSSWATNHPIRSGSVDKTFVAPQMSCAELSAKLTTPEGAALYLAGNTSSASNCHALFTTIPPFCCIAEGDVAIVASVRLTAEGLTEKRFGVVGMVWEEAGTLALRVQFERALIAHATAIANGTEGTREITFSVTSVRNASLLMSTIPTLNNVSSVNSSMGVDVEFVITVPSTVDAAALTAALSLYVEDATQFESALPRLPPKSSAVVVSVLAAPEARPPAVAAQVGGTGGGGGGADALSTVGVVIGIIAGIVVLFFVLGICAVAIVLFARKNAGAKDAEETKAGGMELTRTQSATLLDMQREEEMLAAALQSQSRDAPAAPTPPASPRPQRTAPPVSLTPPAHPHSRGPLQPSLPAVTGKATASTESIVGQHQHHVRETINPLDAFPSVSGLLVEREEREVMMRHPPPMQPKPKSSVVHL